MFLEALYYILCGYGLAVVLDTMLELQRGPSVPLWAWFCLAVGWPVVLPVLGIYAALFTLIKRS